MALEKLTQPVEGELIPASRTGYSRRPSLGTARGVRRELASVYLELRRGEIDERHATSAAYLLRCVLESIRLDEIEQRLTALEETRR
ncbi:hypothetical protein [Sulfuricystis thermophila]|uniref:hypothetical protein n=1 Tax=Sulfuricystis thermophila TaxID=2496847 RepID=UPI001036CC26|nr:hypothetical protein [Sulfuricystis thermophila]